jgi:hypothetical protein
MDIQKLLNLHRLLFENKFRIDSLDINFTRAASQLIRENFDRILSYYIDSENIGAHEEWVTWSQLDLNSRYSSIVREKIYKLIPEFSNRTEIEKAEIVKDFYSPFKIDVYEAIRYIEKDQ